MLEKKILLWILPVVLLFVFCSVKAPEVSVTGEKTALENQVIGTYEQIEEDVWTLTSVRSVGNTAPQAKMSEDKKKVLEAVQGRKFNKDDVEEFLKAGIVGENNRGFLEIIHPENIGNDETLKKRVEKIVQSENEYRKVIMDRIILLNEEAAKAGEENVGHIFAKMNQDNVPAGSWIQLDNGEWVKKQSENK
jgi:uncharacterized protein YdbL (DUF1318 family)